MEYREILTTAETSALVNVPAGTLRWWRHVGEGPKSFTLGKKKVAYKKSDVLAWLEREYAKADATRAA
ncbi:helix-turn-helix domain-containing protein [Propionibacterium freudenreichii]|uniref:helix-turn-helix transcriptional regulator n=1 Tax=Propionibacterium freudenreichii TaxID=1744 RepID=UPI00254AEA51|nr:helix-turn-helix domain-containing protein [Propionibacterium freudenreichii]MDK9624687.1 helix-turn-helix domain-containing protein [Propionibacterium freudenreichii]MDK9645783.1 helix-turn-helix domain-containing protein [Propionibacterium freudenreichii]